MILLKTVSVAAPNRALGLLGVFFCEILVECVSVDLFFNIMLLPPLGALILARCS
jgi:hypothetical protein